jgi:gamma-glutamylputrescine oxidase
MTGETWYHDTAIAAPLADGLSADLSYDVAIVGGGLAGLTLLHELIRAGVDAVLIEKQVVGAGASGRNGGFCSDGWAAGAAQIARLVGPEGAEALATLAAQGVAWMRAKCSLPEYASAGAKPGILTVSLSGRSGGEISGDGLRAMVDSPRYKSGTLDMQAFHFHPLNFMRCLAGEVRDMGGRIFQNTTLGAIARDGTGFQLTVTDGKTIHANRVVLATGGYGGSETGPLARHILSIQTYIGVTAPIAADIRRAIKTDFAVGDTRRAGNYYRMLPDDRLLWGHGITTFGTHDAARIKTNTMRDFQRIYPSAAPDFEYGWAGNMAYAVHQMPLVGQLQPGLFALSGFGGHGMNTAPISAIVLAEALCGQSDRIKLFDAIPKPWNMGKAGPFAVEAQYCLLKMRDYLTERRG